MVAPPAYFKGDIIHENNEEKKIYCCYNKNSNKQLKMG